MIRLVGFDLDGTLLDTLPDLADAVNYGLNQAGLPSRTLEEIRCFVGNGVFELVRRASAPHDTEEIKAAVKSGFDEYYAKHFYDKSQVYPGIRELLEFLRERGIYAAIYSNKPDTFTKQIADTVFPDYPFAAVMGQRSDFPKKPDASQFKEVQKRLGLRNEECLYVGDSDVDIQTAKNAGVSSVAVDWGFRSREFLIRAGAERIVHTADELRSLIAAQSSIV